MSNNKYNWASVCKILPLKYVMLLLRFAKIVFLVRLELKCPLYAYTPKVDSLKLLAIFVESMIVSAIATW